MNEFLKLILSELRGAVGIAAAAVILCVIGIFAAAYIYDRVHKGTKKFPLGRAAAISALAGWTAAVLFLTVLRPQFGGGMNLHLFRAWREAWNSFSFQNWSNVLLNVAMFVPLGVLLPLTAKIFRRQSAAYGVFLLSTLSIELLQLILSNGLFDVDDIFANFIGAAVGYGAAMAVITAVGKDEVERTDAARTDAALYAAVPVLTLAALASIFAVYYIKPYGNLSCAPVYKVDVGDVFWEVDCKLSDDASDVPIYRARSYDKDACVAVGAEFFRSLGIGQERLDTVFYDDFVWMSDHIAASMEIHYADGSRVIRIWSGEAVEVNRETAEKALRAYGIYIPDGATFSASDDGTYTFELERSGDGGRAGYLRAKFVLVDGEVRVGNVRDCFCDYVYTGDAGIISSAEAFSRMKKGEFDGGIFESNAPKTARIVSCSLSYETDTKGFFQPVWVFEVSLDGKDAFKIEIPALA